jgi:hypothetical protein
LRLRTPLTIVVVLVAVAGLGLYVAVNRFADHLPHSVSRACTAQTSTGTVALSFERMANAATISAVALTMRLPDRAVVVALATALQESKLENLDSGDRDSVGLFQQRPSQGWGTPEQIKDPVYAATRFYNALVRVRGWADLRVTDAAQRVQRSAFPEAYEKWADEGQILMEALTGHAPGALSCAGAGEPVLRGADAAESLDAGLRKDWGKITTIPDTQIIGIAVPAGSERSGWQFAHWIVAHSAVSGVQKVRYGDQEWTADSGAWASVTAGTSNHVIAEVYASS